MKQPSRETAGPEAPSIPDRLYFKIGEVSRLTGVEPWVLRYWEKEFDVLRPAKLRQQRRYRRRDVEVVFEIRRLIQDEGFTIAGARRKLRELAGRAEPEAVRPRRVLRVPASPAAEPPSGGGEAEARAALARIRRELESLRDMLE